MSEESSLVPLVQKTVTFYDDEVTALRMEDGTVYVPIRPLCEHLGVSWPSQSNRLNRDPILSEVKGVFMVNTPGGQQQAVCLPLDYLNGWLFKMDAARVKDTVRERLLRYQRDCYKVLAAAFQGTPAASPAPSVLVQVREMGRAIMQMAEEQIEFERRLTVSESKLEIVGQLDERLMAVEQQLSPGNPVTQEQASQISQAVKAVAVALGKKTNRNEFGAIYGELYRKYSLTSYKMLPANQFDDAMKFLTEWHQNIVTDTPF
jgi:hypothetical protein